METTDSGNLKSWTVIVESDDEGNLVLPLPQDLLAEVGWNPGDNLEWYDRGDGTWELKKELSNEPSVSGEC